MPNATVRANARTLPETTNRRGILAAAFAAGATAALPAPAAAQSPALSDVDRQVLDLWARRTELTAIVTRLSEEYAATHKQLPSWVRSGPKYLRRDGSGAGMETKSLWPLASDLSRRPPVEDEIINARPCPQELRDEFVAAFREACDRTGVLEDYARTFAEFAERQRQVEAENRRLGLDVLGLRCDAASRAVAQVENEFDQYLGASVFALAAVLIIAIKDDAEEIEGLTRATLAAIRPQLTGQIADDADRALAENEEVA
jgi:hypothetical protein